MSLISASMQPSLPVPKWLVIALLVLSFLGFADATFLSAEALIGEAPNCVIFSGCEKVTTSSYSHIGPIPIAIFGALFYLSVFVLTLLFLDRKKVTVMIYVSYLSIPALLFTLYLVYLQFFVLQAVCIYCMFSALLSASIFVFSHIARVQIRRAQIATTSTL